MYDLTVFTLHFGKLTLKAHTKGEQVPRFEAIAHTVGALDYGRVLARFPRVVARLRGMVDRWLDQGGYLERAVVAAATLDDLATPTQLGRTRVGGMDVNKPRMRAVLAAVLVCAVKPTGFRVGDLDEQVSHRARALGASYGTRQAADDVRKLRAKGVVDQVPDTRLGTHRGQTTCGSRRKSHHGARLAVV